MFGAVIFLPLFFQVVEGVSATASGLLLLPLMGGLLVTSIGSGQFISRTGRYKVFPLVGTALSTCGLFLLSRMTAETSHLVSSLYMLVLGLGLGLVMQVLVIAVQNAVDYRELGVATSAATFFRSVGGSFGVAIFGAIFNHQLAVQLTRLMPEGTEVAGLGSSGLQANPAQIAALPPEIHAAFVQAFAASLDAVFLAAVPFALVGFALTWLLPEVPLRTTAGAMAGLDESFGMPALGLAALKEEARVRRLAAEAALARLDTRQRQLDLPPALVERLRAHYENRLTQIAEHDRVLSEHADFPAAYWELCLELLDTERVEIERLDRQRDASPDVLQRFERDLQREAPGLSA
jgi:hypothetical protein